MSLGPGRACKGPAWLRMSEQARQPSPGTCVRIISPGLCQCLQPRLQSEHAGHPALLRALTWCLSFSCQLDCQPRWDCACHRTQFLSKQEIRLSVKAYSVLFSCLEHPAWLVTARAKGRLPICLVQGAQLFLLPPPCGGRGGQVLSGRNTQTQGRQMFPLCCLLLYLCLQDSSQACVRTRLILVCSQQGQVTPPSGQSHGHSAVLFSLILSV